MESLATPELPRDENPHSGFVHRGSPHSLSPEASAAPALSEMELRVLETLSRQHRLTFGQLLRATPLGGEELRLALRGLRMKGYVACLQTVIESYCCRTTGPDPTME